jgi:hypothetical protein
VLACEIDDLGAGRNAARSDPLDPIAANEHVRRDDVPFVHDRGVDQRKSFHAAFR